MTVFICDLDVCAQVGVHAHEHGRTQPLSFDIEIKLSPSTRDEIADTLDYEGVVSLIEQMLAEAHIQLVETVARRIAHAIQADPRVIEVMVKVKKPSALPTARMAGVVWSTSLRQA